MGLDARLVCFAFACLPVLCLFRFVFYYNNNRKNQVIIFLQVEEKMEREEKADGDANQVDEEHNNRRASIFLPINPLRINTSRFGSIATRWGWNRSIPGLVTCFSRS